ncbi:MAG: amino acid ABC transporter permease [Methylibium sp. NZG]|nr:MAG: amino acid ABC transporter permease [Methylibium sp. NZG]
MFDGWLNTFATLAVLSALVWALPPLWRWGVAHAVFVADNAACRAAAELGACWGVVAEKHRLILFGRYPHDAHWRPLAACVLLVVMIVISGWWPFARPARWPLLGRALLRFRPTVLLAAWAAVVGVVFVLMRGGAFGLTPVDTSLWGGLPLTLLLSTASLVLAFPLAVLLALGRQSPWPGIRWLCTVYVELLRGVPLIAVLFMASFMLPLLMPQDSTVDVLLRVLVGLTLFGAAHLAEVVRGGLQGVPQGQVLAAQALGLGYWQTTLTVVLPQSLRSVVPALVNTCIGALKDTSLVTIVSLYDLTGALQLALGDANWRRFFIEGQLFVAAVYFVFCFALSRYSRWIERRLNAGTRRA